MTEVTPTTKPVQPSPRSGFVEIAKEEVANTTTAFFAPFIGAYQVVSGLIRRPDAEGSSDSR